MTLIFNYIIKKHFIIILLIQFAVFNSFSQNKSIYGTITDKLTGESLIGVNVVVLDENKGTATNNYGFYSIAVSNGTHKVQYSYIGYNVDTLIIDLDGSLRKDIQLRPAVMELSEVTISEDRKSLMPLDLNRNSLNIHKIAAIPAILGEPDVFKSLQYMPGIQTAKEGTTNISVRGGSHDGNLILLDEAVVYNPNHALSFFSVFNPDAIKDITIYKGAFPVQYGGRISSVIDIRMKEGNNKKLTIGGSLGLISSGLNIEGPILSDRTSFLISGRYSYAGSVVNGLKKLADVVYISELNNLPDNNKISFYDLTFKVNHLINNKNRIYFSFYSGKDEFYFRMLSNNSDLNWGNNTATLRLNHIYNSQFFSNHSLIMSNYGYNYYLLDEQRKFNWKSGLKELNYKLDFDWYLNSTNHLRFGSILTAHFFEPGQINKSDTNSITRSFSLGDKNAIDVSLYLSNNQKIKDNILLEYGLRYTSFITYGAEEIYKYDSNQGVIYDTIQLKPGAIEQFYQGLEPRINFSYILAHNNSIKASYSRNKQYLFLISNSSVGMPTDIWLPAGHNIKPMTSDQYTIGYFQVLKNRPFEFSSEIYYREIGNVVDFIDNTDLFLNNQIETQLRSGIRKAYGIEFMLQKTTGKMTGWISYTLSESKQKIDGINNDNWYHPTFDKTHNLSLLFSYQFAKSWVFSANFKYTSGGYLTVPKEAFFFEGVPFVQYSERNGYELPAYHRLDLSMTYKSKKNANRKLQGEWILGVYNAYNRKNIFSLFSDLNSLFDLEITKLYLFGIVPSISYNFKF